MPDAVAPDAVAPDAERWERALARWAWPEAILAAAPADPWSLSPTELAGHRRSERTSLTPADVAALEALPRGGTVLDVGCGTGAASVALRPAASHITGVDTRPAMLEVFEAETAARPGLVRRMAGGAPVVSAALGRWPAAGSIPVHDVVVCHHVLYDVGVDVAGFVRALTDHARTAVVLVLTERHPLHWTNPYAELLHGITRPADPDADLAAGVVQEVAGVMPTMVRWTELLDPPEDEAAFERMVARRCCVGEDRLHDVGLALHRVPPPDTRRLVALTWPGSAA